MVDGTGNAYRKRVAQNRLHGWLLEIACAIVGRDYNEIVKLQSYREEQHTIHCFYAIFIVVFLAVLTMQSGIGFLFFDLQKYLRSSTAQYVLEGLDDKKLLVSVFWGFIIYYIDMTILNGQAVKAVDGDSEDVGFFKALLAFLSRSSLGFLLSNKLLLFRVMLIVSVATISSVFLMANFTAQLLAYKERQTAISGISKDRDSASEEKKGLKLLNSHAQTQKKLFGDELLKLNSDKRAAEIEFRRRLNEINIEEKRLAESYQAKIRECTSCSPEELDNYHTRISSVRERARINRSEVRASFEVTSREIANKITDANLHIKSIDKDISANTSTMEHLDSQLDKLAVQKELEADRNISESKSLAALIIYPFKLPWEEKMLCLMMFIIIFSIIAVADISVLVVKFSYRSLYDIGQDARDGMVSAELQSQTGNPKQ